MKISSDYEDLLRAFSDTGVEFLVAGAYAVIHYTEPRFTRDIDLWVRPDAEDASRVLQARVAESEALEFGHVEVRVLGLDSLRTAKRHAGRPQDLLDLDLLDQVARKRDRKGS